MSGTTPEEIPVRSITLMRAEGLVHETRVSRTVESFDAADKVLWDWGATAPNDGSYHKVDVRILFMDGTTRTFRYDLQRQRYAWLAAHVSAQLARGAERG